MALRIQLVALGDLARAPRNPKGHDQPGIAAAKALVDDALDSVSPTPESARQLEAARYDAMWGRAWGVLVGAKGDPEAVLRALDRCMGIAERRAKLLGLDAPARRPVRGEP